MSNQHVQHQYFAIFIAIFTNLEGWKIEYKKRKYAVTPERKEFNLGEKETDEWLKSRKWRVKIGIVLFSIFLRLFRNFITESIFKSLNTNEDLCPQKAYMMRNKKISS